MIHKSLNYFAACKHVTFVSSNFIKPDFASKRVCKVPSKPVKCKVVCQPVFNVPSKPVKCKFLCKTLYPVNSSNPVRLVDVSKLVCPVNPNKIYALLILVHL